MGIRQKRQIKKHAKLTSYTVYHASIDNSTLYRSKA